jgi:hypothetical protein
MCLGSGVRQTFLFAPPPPEVWTFCPVSRSEKTMVGLVRVSHSHDRPVLRQTKLHRPPRTGSWDRGRVASERAGRPSPLRQRKWVAFPISGVAESRTGLWKRVQIHGKARKHRSRPTSARPKLRRLHSMSARIKSAKYPWLNSQTVTWTCLCPALIGPAKSALDFSGAWLLTTSSVFDDSTESLFQPKPLRSKSCKIGQTESVDSKD